MSSEAVKYQVTDVSELFEWIEANAFEILNRKGKFTTVTVQTKEGLRAFRASGKNSFVDAIHKAKVYVESEAGVI